MRLVESLMSTREGLDGLRDELVDQLCAAGVVRVAWALRSVPRHLFVPGEPERAGAVMRRCPRSGRLMGGRSAPRSRG